MLSYSAISKKGLKCPYNEDRVQVNNKMINNDIDFGECNNIIQTCVCDGIGKKYGSDTASSLVCKMLADNYNEKT